jgi:hypothetical protein
MVKKIKTAAIVLVALFVLAAIFGKSENGATPQQKENIKAAKAYQMTQNEQTLYDIIFKDDINTFIDGGGSFIESKTGDIIRASAAEVAGVYKKNQVAGDQKYYEKQILLTGKIDGIQSGIGNRPYLTLRGEMFSEPQVHFKRSVSVERVANLSKGQAVSFVCKGNGAVVGTPMFDDCVFTDDFAENLLKTEDFPEAKLYVVAFAGMLKEGSPCFADSRDDKKCLKELRSFNADENSKKAALVAASQKTGIQLPKTTEEPPAPAAGPEKTD